MNREFRPPPSKRTPIGELTVKISFAGYDGRIVKATENLTVYAGETPEGVVERAIKQAMAKFAPLQQHLEFLKLEEVS